jgi:TolB-like protein/Tfp pilus assembly protein PilF
VGRCLEKDATQRPGSAGELLRELRAAQSDVAAARSAARRRRARLFGGLTTLAASLALLVLAVRARVTSSEPRVRSLAVLPVRDLTAGASSGYFADGMTDLLTNELSQLGGLRRVSSQTSVMPYRNTRKPAREIGRELGVDALVDASVLKAGERVRVDVRLIDAARGRVLWGRGFERPMRDVLALRQEIARAIARELRVPLTPRETARLTVAAHRVDPEAFALYLQSARTINDPRGLAYLEQAIAKDSAFALAHARIALGYVMTGQRAKAERTIAKAIALDPSLSEAYDALGLLRMWTDWDWAAAEAALRRSVELNPHNSRAHHELCQLLMRVKRCDEAVPEEQRAILEDPGSAGYQSGLAEVYLYCRRYDEAIREFEKTLSGESGATEMTARPASRVALARADDGNARDLV